VIENLVELVGIEPTTSSLRTMASAKLSHCLACTWQPSTVHYGPIQNSGLPGSPQHQGNRNGPLAELVGFFHRRRDSLCSGLCSKISAKRRRLNLSRGSISRVDTIPGLESPGRTDGMRSSEATLETWE
jgi:hypothetical protein